MSALLSAMLLLAPTGTGRAPVGAQVRLGRSPRSLIVARAFGADGCSEAGAATPAGARDARSPLGADAERIEREVYLHPEDMPYREGTRPESALALGLANFRRCARARVRAHPLPLPGAPCV